MVKRPALRYHGGKWRLAPWIIEHFPPHRTYVEPFGGAASVLLRKPRSYAEVYNDLSCEIVNLFRVLRDPVQSRELIRQVSLTPYARTEFEQSYLASGDPIEQARRTLFRSAAGHSTAGAQGRWKTGFRAKVDRSFTTPVMDWQNLPRVLEQIAMRLQGVVIENRPALDVIQRFDTEATLHYLDPPYPHKTRNERWAGKCYEHEMTDDDHRDLASLVKTCKGAVVISGYACQLYDTELYPDWQRVQRKAWADGANARTEVLWLSPSSMSLSLFPLFAGAMSIAAGDSS